MRRHTTDRGSRAVRRTRERCVRRFVVGMCVVSAALSAATVTASNGTTFTSPRTGTPYDVVHTCASSTTSVRFRPVPNVGPVELWVTASDRRGPNGPRIAVFESSSGAPMAFTKSSGVETLPITSVEFEDRFDGDADLTRVGTLQVSCPDYAALPSTAYTSMAPVRVLDTRPASLVGPTTGARPGAGSSTDVVLAGRHGIPADVVAVALNVTATEAAAAGYVQAFPTGRAAPGSSSTLNVERAGQTIANGSIVPVGDGGAVTLFSQSGAHLVADVVGYFRAASGAVSAGRLIATTPTRILDTRGGSAVNSNGVKPGVGSVLTVDATAAPSVVPAGRAAAVVIGLTATETDAPGFLQVAAAGALVPGAASALNADRAGQTIANTVTVPVSADGRFDVFVQAGSHVIVDLLGWYTNSSNPTSTSGLYVPLTPERVFDSRWATCVNCTVVLNERATSGALLPGKAARVELGKIERRATAVVANITATEVVGPGFFQAGAMGAIVPGASSTLNAVAGQTIANSAIVPLGREFDGLQAGLAVYSQSGGHVVVDVSGFFTR